MANKKRTDENTVKRAKGALEESIEERMEDAKLFFERYAESCETEDEREIAFHLRRMAESMQETIRQLDYLKSQMENVRHVLSLH